MGLVLLSSCSVWPSAREPDSVMQKTALSGKRQVLQFYDALNADCGVAGVPSVKIIQPPRDGVATVELAADYPSFPSDNPRYVCNRAKAPGAQVVYRSSPQYLGADRVVVEIVYPSGTVRNDAFDVFVK
jgi:hypothetical protein